MNSPTPSNAESAMDAWLNGVPSVDPNHPPCQATDSSLDEFVRLAFVEGLLQSHQASAAAQAKRLRAILHRRTRPWLGVPFLMAAAALVALSLVIWKLWPQPDGDAIAHSPPTRIVPPAVARPSVEMKSVVDHSLAVEDKAYHYKLSSLIVPEYSVADLRLGEALQVLLTAQTFPSELELPEFYIAPDLALSELRRVKLRLNFVSCESLVQVIAMQSGCRAQRSGKGFYFSPDPALADSSAGAKLDISAKEAGYLIARQSTNAKIQEEPAVALERTLQAAFDEPLKVEWLTEPRYQIQAKPRLIAVMEELKRDLAFSASHYEIQADPLYVTPNSPLHQKMRAQQATGIVVLGVFPTDDVKQHLTGGAQTLTHAPISGPQGVWLSCAGISWERHNLHNEIILLKNKADSLRKSGNNLSQEALAQELAQNQQEQAAKQAQHDALIYAVRIFPHPSGKMQLAVQVLDAIEIYDLPDKSTLVFTVDAGEKPIAGIVNIRPVESKK